MSNANEKPASNVQAFLLVDRIILACDWTTKKKAQLSLDESQIRSLISLAVDFLRGYYWTSKSGISNLWCAPGVARPGVSKVQARVASQPAQPSVQ